MRAGVISTAIRVACVPAIALLPVLQSCSSTATTRIAPTWSDPQFKGTRFSNLLVVGIARVSGPRRAFERTLKQELEKRGARGVSALDVISKDEKISRETFEKYFRDYGFDGVIVASARSADTRETVARPGASQRFVDPSAAPGSFYSDYLATTNLVYYPPPVTEREVFVVETVLYETQEGKPVWRAISETVDPQDLNDMVQSLSESLLNQLTEEGYMGP